MREWCKYCGEGDNICNQCELSLEHKELEKRFQLTKEALDRAAKEMCAQQTRLDEAIELLDLASDAVNQDSYTYWWERYRAFLSIEL